MISFSQYRMVLRELAAAGIQSQRVDSLHSERAKRGDLYIKHDVEARIDRAVRMARIEAEEGHQATYYFQGDLVRKLSASDRLQAISELGHEVTYHYDVLDANAGDEAAASIEFEEYCSLFKELGYPVTTVCPHGNPTKLRYGWSSNKDFFRSKLVREQFPGMIDIVVDFPRLIPEGVYISDAGRSLRVIGKIAENDRSVDEAMSDGRVIDWPDIERLVNDSSGVVLSLHPHRLYGNDIVHKAELIAFHALKHAYLKLKRIPAIEILASRFYKIARRF